MMFNTKYCILLSFFSVIKGCLRIFDKQINNLFDRVISISLHRDHSSFTIMFQSIMYP